MTMTSLSQFQPVINNALEKFQRRTEIDLLAYPLTARFISCASPSNVLSILRQQFEGPDQSRGSRGSDELWTRWVESLYPIVSILFTLSMTLDAGVHLVFPPASTIFTGIHLLLLVAKRTRARQDTLTDILKRIEKCFQPLEMHLEFLTTEMTDLII
ncbi:hypothetical protein BGY98DRAFT_939153 [Russula aff. rugulosa BPL654]|nr:hypothetical protein BGY98DRAFT_939153 [Russula aff. rugulosa BPL654]